MVQAAAPPTAAAAGSVSSQDSAMRPATPHRTWASLRPRPAPRMLPVHTCVVDRGNPMWDEARITAVALVSAAKP